MIGRSPQSPADVKDATWAELEPLYDDLGKAPMDGVTTWLADWTRLQAVVMEAASLASIAYTADTADPAKEAAAQRWRAEIGPKLQERNVALADRLLESGYEEPGIAAPLRRFRNQRDLFRKENVELQAQEQQLMIRHQKLTGGLTVDWEGEKKTIPELSPYKIDADRDVRERAHRLIAGAYLEHRQELAGLLDEMIDLRTRMAKNAGFDNYRDYAHQQKDRFDYTPADCHAFHDAVEATVVPALKRLNAKRAETMRLDAVRIWDTDCDPHGRPPLRPFETQAQLEAGCQRVFEKVDPAFGGYFATMSSEALLDLESRSGKAPGGYCTGLPFRKRPFIFMNSSGVAGDVRTLLHESGHAFHGFETYRLPYFFQRFTGSEFAEVASMSMELLSSPYLEDSGMFDADAAARAREEHLEGVLRILAHIASIDAFQQWMYTDPAGRDAGARDREWEKIRRRLDGGIEWQGAEDVLVSRWYQQLHIFLYPFYYIEYGIAQLGALQVWRNALDDQAGAVAAYRGALALGYTKPLPELFAAAGARLVFDAGGMGELVELVESQAG